MRASDLIRLWLPLALTGCAATVAATSPPAELSPLAAGQARLLAPEPAGWWQSIGAEGDEAFVGSSRDAAVWMSRQTRRSPSGTRIVFTHWEYAAREGDLGVLSRRTVAEIDCGQGRSRILESYAYPARQAVGAPVDTVLAPGPWTYIEPGSVTDGEARLACRPARMTAHRQAPPARKAPAEDAPDSEGPPHIASDYL